MGPPGIRVPLAWIHRLKRGATGGSAINKTAARGSASKTEASATANTTNLVMDSLLGLLRVRIKRGVNLAVRDVCSSDPYVVVKMGKQKLRTHFLKKDVNPEWNEDLTLYISDPNIPIKLTVFDHDTFSKDDKMGCAEIDIKPLLDTLKMNLEGMTNESVLTSVQPGKSNCLAKESCVVLKDGKVSQDMCLRLRNVESGEIEIELEWINLPGNKS